MHLGVWPATYRRRFHCVGVAFRAAGFIGSVFFAA